MKIGIVGGAMKPVTKGHWELIKRASRENNVVKLFISTSDRGGEDGEALIKGSDMVNVWETYITCKLPPNVSVQFGGSPIRKIYELLGEANENNSIDTFTVYSDPKDIEGRFDEFRRLKYFPELTKHNQVNFIAVERTNEMAVSATQMRRLLAHGMKDEFISLLPNDIDGQGVWKLLLMSTFVENV